jgi:hypothetical protein
VESTACPHCGAANPSGAAFCESCGKALPGAVSTPRVITGTVQPMTGAGRSLVADDLHRTTKKAATALMWVAILQTFLGPVALYLQISRLERENPGMQYEIQPFAWATVLGIAAVFWGLFLWARRNPLPAAIVGLIVFISIHALDAVLDPRTLAHGIFMKIIVIAVLSRAISAGVKHRRLLEEQRAAGGVAAA